MDKYCVEPCAGGRGGWDEPDARRNPLKTFIVNFIWNLLSKGISIRGDQLVSDKHIGILFYMSFCLFEKLLLKRQHEPPLHGTLG